MPAITLGRSTWSGRNPSTTAASTHRSQRSPLPNDHVDKRLEKSPRNSQWDTQDTDEINRTHKRRDDGDYRSETSPRDLQRDGNGRNEMNYTWNGRIPSTGSTWSRSGQGWPRRRSETDKIDDRSEARTTDFHNSNDKLKDTRNGRNKDTPMSSTYSDQQDTTNPNGDRRNHPRDDTRNQSEVQRDLHRDASDNREPSLIMSEDAIRKAVELDQVAKTVRERAKYWNRLQAQTLGELERMRREMISGMAFSESKTAQAFIEEKNKDLVIALRKTEYRNQQLTEALRECNKYNRQHVVLHERMTRVLNQ